MCLEYQQLGRQVNFAQWKRLASKASSIEEKELTSEEHINVFKSCMLNSYIER